MKLYAISSFGGNTELLLQTKNEEQLPTDWSPDGRYVLFEEHGPEGADLWSLEIVSRKASPLVQGRGDQGEGRFSPDGHWVAYVSNESGRSEVYLQALTGGSRVQVSSGGGSLPRWKNDGREIYYITLDSKLMVTEFTPNAPQHVGEPRALFTLPRGANYEVSRDGRFLVNLPLHTPEKDRLSVVVNWPAELKK